jgi:hypothetical protein
MPRRSPTGVRPGRAPTSADRWRGRAGPPGSTHRSPATGKQADCQVTVSAPGPLHHLRALAVRLAFEVLPDRETRRPRVSGTLRDAPFGFGAGRTHGRVVGSDGMPDPAIRGRPVARGTVNADAVLRTAAAVRSRRPDDARGVRRFAWLPSVVAAPGRSPRSGRPATSTFPTAGRGNSGPCGDRCRGRSRPRLPAALVLAPARPRPVSAGRASRRRGPDVLPEAGPTQATLTETAKAVLARQRET